jgi:teichuronic acid biosynthesis glycosyltransferase TuaC
MSLRVLFVNSANKKKRISPFIVSQAVSLRDNGVLIEYFSLDEGGIIGYLKHAIKLRRLLKHEKYDIIHAHYALMGFISSYARRKEKLIVSLMGCDILGSYRSDGSLVWSEQIIVVAARLFSRFYWDHVILKSSNMINKLMRKTRFSVIPNGVNLELFKPMDKESCRKSLNLSIKKKYILFPSNPDRQEKNYPLASESCEIVKQRGFNDVELIVVHKLTYEALLLYYNAVDVCILTSRSEGSPNVIKECMACNVPLVSTNVGDVKEIVGATDGCYIAKHDPADFAEKIINALEFNTKTSGRKRVEPLEINLISQKIIAIYQSFIKV